MKLNAKERLKIRAEINDWRSESLIDQTLSNTLLQRYELPAPGSGHITAILTMGAVLIGAGTLLFVGAHWEAMSALAKLAIIILAMLGFYLLGWRFRFEPGNRPRLGSAMLLIGTLIYGAGIWLTSQIFNLTISIEGGVLLWALGTLAVALATRSSGPCTLFSILAMTWALSHNFDLLGHANDLIPSLRIMAAFLASVALAYNFRSKAAIACSAGLSALAFLILSFSTPAQFALLPWGICLFALYLMARPLWQPAASSFMYAGSVSCIVALLDLSFWSNEWPLRMVTTQPVMIIIALAALALATCCRNEFKWEAVAAAVLAVLPAILLLSPSKSLFLLGINIMLIAGLIALLWSAQSRLREPGLINVAIAGFVLEVICRYFDFFFTMLDRSLAFTLGGILLLMIGALAERGRRRLLEGIRA